MGSRLLNGSLHLSVRVTLLPLILIVLSSIVTLGTITGTPIRRLGGGEEKKTLVSIQMIFELPA